MTSDETRLVAAARSGDRAAFGLLVAGYRPRLLRLSRQLTGASDLAEDCVQDACLVAWLRLDQLRAAEAFGAWLQGILRHVCQRATRDARRCARPGSSVAHVLDDDDDGGQGVETLEERRELGRVLEQAVAGLPAGQRKAAVAFYLEDLSYVEAAAALGISVSALKVRLHAARRSLRHRYRLVDAPAARRTQPAPHVLAVHEAGHAVLHVLAGGAIQQVSIAPADGVGRRVAPTAPVPQLAPRDALRVRLAGEAATLVEYGRRAGGWDSRDRSAAAALARHLTDGDEVEAALLVDAALAAACERLLEPATWQRVQRVAAALLAAGQVDGRRLGAVLAG